MSTSLSGIGLVRRDGQLIVVTSPEVPPGASAGVRHGEPPQHEMVLGLRCLRASSRPAEFRSWRCWVKRASSRSGHAPAGSICLEAPTLIRRAMVNAGTLTAGKSEPELDCLEMALVNAAHARGLPVLAICRRMWALNAAGGGTLHQHLPDVVGEHLAGCRQQPGPVSTHLVAVEQGSRLHHLLDRRRLRANSFQDQAVAALGRGLVVSKRAPDGTVESMDAEDRDFAAAVQWHAEYLTKRSDQTALCTSS